MLFPALVIIPGMIAMVATPRPSDAGGASAGGISRGRRGAGLRHHSAEAREANAEGVRRCR